MSKRPQTEPVLKKPGRPMPLLKLGVLAGLLVLAGVAAFWATRTYWGNAPAPSEGERVCRQFMEWKNAKDPRAMDLLGPEPQVPPAVASEEAAEQLDAELILRRDSPVVEVRPDTSGLPHPFPRFILVTKGGYDAHYHVATPTGPKPRSRSLFNPDVVVEVRDGKIIGLRAQLHEDINQRPMTPHEQERIKRLLLPSTPQR